MFIVSRRQKFTVDFFKNKRSKEKFTGKDTYLISTFEISSLNMIH
jgi:hypothetical protein